MADKLEFKITLDRNDNPLATINNFPGLYAEMSKKDLERMARELLEIAKKM
jgi:hypothetical protein